MFMHIEFPSGFIRWGVFLRLYVMSVDGVLSALDWEGRQVWSYQLAEPLFSSTLNYKVFTLNNCESALIAL